MSADGGENGFQILSAALQRHKFDPEPRSSENLAAEIREDAAGRPVLAVGKRPAVRVYDGPEDFAAFWHRAMNARSLAV